MCKSDQLMPGNFDERDQKYRYDDIYHDGFYYWPLTGTEFSGFN